MLANLIHLIPNATSISLLIVAIMALSATLFQNRVKKYEVKRDYQNSVIAWFSKTTAILIRLRFMLVNNDNEFKQNKNSLLAELSTQIEIGRLYFPNIDKGDGHGLEKPKAYRGHRNLTLVFLVYSFDIFVLDDALKYEKHLLRLQREFTSIISETIDPDSFLKETEKHSDKFFSQRLSVQEFINMNPDSIDLFFVKHSR